MVIMVDIRMSNIRLIRRILRARLHRAKVKANAIAKAISLQWVLSISIVPFTLSKSESDVTNGRVHDPFEAMSLSHSILAYVNKP